MDEALSAQKGTGVWFVYDGDCPMCSMAAHAFRIRQRYGLLHLIDARRDETHPLLQEIRRRKLDLDAGMVIWWDGQFHHGQDALRFMAQFGDDKGWLNRLNRLLFRSAPVARLGYPWLRAIRNLLLRLRGVERLDNLRDRGDPLFRSVFGEDWEKLPLVLRRHYANRAFHDDIVRVEGRLTVEASSLGRALAPAFRFAKALVPCGKDIPVTVDFVTEARSSRFRFERLFHFPDRPPYRFRSAMIPIAGNELIEMMGHGVGWRTAYRWDGRKVILSHRGYVVRLFGVFVPVPLTPLIGSGYAEETAIDDDTFSMWTEIRHPWWGKVFGYRGSFKVTKDR